MPAKKINVLFNFNGIYALILTKVKFFKKLSAAMVNIYTGRNTFLGGVTNHIINTMFRTN